MPHGAGAARSAPVTRTDERLEIDHGRAAALVLGRASEREDRAACLAIRRRVFIEEQGVPESIEIDGLDGGAIHYLARLASLREHHVEPGAGPDTAGAGRAVATARVRMLASEAHRELACPDGSRLAKIQRVAVLAPLRGLGIGARLMRHVLTDIARAPDCDGVGAVVLGSQESAVPFYRGLGFVERGHRFMEAGIAHRMMMLTIGHKIGPDGVRPPWNGS